MYHYDSLFLHIIYNCIENYRPISLLTAFSKVFEKIILFQIENFFNDNNLFFAGQYGFRKGHSTELAATELIDRVIHSLDKGNTPYNIYLDLSKAFDTINHEILIEKLKYYGFSQIALKLITSYLKNRKQYVKYNETNSIILDNTCGVPQGSILGPLLFIIYLNDISKSSNMFKFIIYADDTTIVGEIMKYQNKHKMQYERKINEELLKVNLWLQANKLTVNVKKSKSMFFFKHPKVIDPPKLKLDNIDIENVDKFNFLGVYINQNLTWFDHINAIGKKVARSIGILSRLKFFLPYKILILIYNSLILSHFSYGLLLWGYDNQKIFKLQKKAIKSITNSKIRTHSDPLFKRLELLKIKDLHFLKQAKFFFKLKNNQLPQYFMQSYNHLLGNQVNPVYNTRFFTTRRTHHVKHEFAKNV